MHVVSVNVGLAKTVIWQNQTVKTGIFKSPVQQLVRVHADHLEGDEQADLKVHGGLEKSVYVYPSEHYSYWQKKLPEWQRLPWGMFGENLTTEELRETDICIGDRLQIGTAKFQVIQPRRPCYKLNLKFNQEDMVEQFWHSRLLGFYLSVLQPGEIQLGDEIIILQREPHPVTVSDIINLYCQEPLAPDLLIKIINLSVVPGKIKQLCQQQLDQQ